MGTPTPPPLVLSHGIGVTDLIRFVGQYGKKVPADHLEHYYTIGATDRSAWCSELTTYMRENNIDFVAMEQDY